MRTESFDILVVGGGVVGAGVARDVACRGFATALVDRGDFASGTSGKTSRLVHGGLRYLRNYRFGLVRRAVRERDLLLRNAPGLVHPLPFLIPAYADHGPRSEEHTSELQSQSNLVCRLLLETKKNPRKPL